MDASVTLSLNSGPFAQGIQQAEAQARSFSGRIGGLSKGIEGLFRRSPERRAELAIHGLVSSLASGDVSGGIANLIGGMSGLGLAAGVGIGAGVAAFVKFKSQIDATTKATEALNKEIGKPISFQAALGPEGIGKEVDSISKAIDDLATKRQSLGSRIQEAAIAGAPDSADTSSAAALAASLQTPTDRTNPAADSQAKGEKRLKDLVEARATAELKAVQIRRTGLTVSEREGDALKIQADFAKKAASLFLERGPGTKGFDKEQLLRSYSALYSDKQLSGDVARNKADQRERELKAEQSLADLDARGASTGEQKLAKLRAELGLIQEKLKVTTAVEARQGLQVEQTKARTALAQAQGTDRQLPDTIIGENTIQGWKYQSDQYIPDAREMGINVRQALQGIFTPGEASAAGGAAEDFWRANAPKPFSQGELAAESMRSQLTGMVPPGVINAAVGTIFPSESKAGSGSTEVVGAIDKLSQKMDNYWGK